MSKTNAERQTDYRRKSVDLNDKDGERRINTFVRSQAYYALRRPAAHRGVSKKEIIETLLIEADELATKEMDIDSTEFDEYFFRETKNSPLRSNNLY